MAAGAPTYEAVSMIEVLISYQLPESLDEPELRSWLADQMHALSAEEVAFLPPDGSTAHDREGLVRFTLDSDTDSSAKDRIADLCTDMRMLGLRPETVAVEPGQSGVQTPARMVRAVEAPDTTDSRSSMPSAGPMPGALPKRRVGEQSSARVARVVHSAALPGTHKSHLSSLSHPPTRRCNPVRPPGPSGIAARCRVALGVFRRLLARAR
jgi:hypothetical protein